MAAEPAAPAPGRGWPAALTGRRQGLLALGAGLLAGLGYAPLGLWPLTLLGLTLVALQFATAPTPRRAAWLAWLSGVAAWGVSVNWIVEPFLVDIVRHGWMAPFALVFTSGGFALFWAGAAALAHRFGGLLLFAALLPLSDMARGMLLTGFPWNLPGYVWIDTSLAQLAAWIGPYGLTAVTYALPLLAAALWLRGRRGLAALPLVVPAAAALLWPVPPAPAPAADAPVIRLVQPNAAQHLKWDPEHRATFFRRQVEMSAAAPRPDLVVWPETSFMSLLNHGADALDHIAEQTGGVPAVIGAVREEGGRYYNALVVTDGAGEVTDLYDKHHLVPFGEYLPLGGLLERLGLRALADRYGSYAAGPGPKLIDLGPLGRALPLICYEAIFPEEVGAPADRPAFLLQITNDAWFGTLSGPYQHLVQARMRAIEQGLPLFRAANTGVSASVDARGRVTASLPLGQEGHLDAPLPPPLPPTLYARTGDWPAGGALLLMALAGLAAGRHGRARAFAD